MRAVAVGTPWAAPALVELPKPDPAPGELRVRIEYASLNPHDRQLATGAREGLPEGLAEGRAPRVFPLVVGVDYAGRVDMIGSGENRFRVGDHVFGRVGGPAADGRAVGGTYCEYVCVPQDSALALIPPGLDARLAAALPSAGMAAAQILEAVSPRGHESLLVVGAAGGVGSCLTQLARARDVRVIAAVRGDERARMGSLGAVATIDVTDGPAADAIRAACPDGVDALADLASATPEAFGAYAAALRPGGLALSTRGVAAGAVLPAGVRGVDFRLDPSPVLLDVLAAGAADGILRVPIDAELTLEQAPQALDPDRTRAGGARGKTVIVLRRHGPH
ncbi:NADP-dependent oxidoreductase [Streptomyces sp. A0642]|uniref:NADP-dependent oxidoreductase n=1 Tax=Streptomyces sp. A0642 TaxID=2563100 RepID=UPI0010A22DE0|nr:NADP-dependent oxidoreductase [Streptomyces sp. A0642]THA76526.1 NADP-dependent oxidoreductase [Streptomyces sp. A0642]